MTAERQFLVLICAALLMVSALPARAMDLYPSTHDGWSGPIVPRAENTSNWDFCPLPSILNGWSPSSYINFAGYQNETWPWNCSDPWTNRIYLDDVYIAYTDFDGYCWFTWYGSMNFQYQIPGGRHTLHVAHDYYNNVSEEDENNNQRYDQYVWSPYDLVSLIPYSVSSASGGYFSYRNVDGFQFTPINYWTAVGVRYGSDDYDMAVYRDYGGSTAGFASPLESSTYGSGYVDFIAVDGNHVSGVATQAGVYDYSGTGSYTPYLIEVDNTAGDSFSYSGGTVFSSSYPTSYNEVIRCHESYWSTTGSFWITLINNTGGDLDLHFFGSTDGDYFKSRSAAMGTRYDGGSGQIDQVNVTVSTSGDYYAIVVTNENGASGSYILSISPDRYTPTPTPSPSPSPTRTPTYSPTATPAWTNTPTITPSPTDTALPTETPTPEAIPATGDVGIALLVLVISILVLRAMPRR